MTFSATKAEVANRGVPSDSFLAELVAWGKTAPETFFAPNPHFDIYSKARTELGPWESAMHRRAVMMEVMRVLAGFESSWDWSEGVDASRRSGTTSENAEAGAWQVSWDARRLDQSLVDYLAGKPITDGLAFQRAIKRDHLLAMDFIALLLRIDVKNFQRIVNGPVRKGDEREKTWPDRPSLWPARQSIYPWLSRAAAAEFQSLLLLTPSHA